MRHKRAAIILAVTAALTPAMSAAGAPDELGNLLGQLTKGPFEKATLLALEGQPDDGRVVPALHFAFTQAADKSEKQWIASTLLRLGDSTQEYSDFLIDSATEALEDRSPLFADYDSDGNMVKGRFSAKFEVWCRANGKDPRSVAALQFGTYPEDVLVLARARDPRAKEALRRGLQSPNPLVVGYSVQGLARIQDVSAIPIIAAMAENSPASTRTLISMNLPWYSAVNATLLIERLTPDLKVRAPLVRQVQAEQLLDQQNALRRLAKTAKQ